MTKVQKAEAWERWRAEVNAYNAALPRRRHFLRALELSDDDARKFREIIPDAVREFEVTSGKLRDVLATHWLPLMEPGGDMLDIPADSICGEYIREVCEAADAFLALTHGGRTKSILDGEVHPALTFDDRTVQGIREAVVYDCEVCYYG